MRHLLIAFLFLAVCFAGAMWYMYFRSNKYWTLDDQRKEWVKTEDYFSPDDLSLVVEFSLLPGDDLNVFFAQLFERYQLKIEYLGDRSAASEIVYAGPLETGLVRLMVENRLLPEKFSTGTLLKQMHPNLPLTE